MKPIVRSVFHAPSHTYSYVVWDPETLRAAIIDPALDYDPHAGRTDTQTAQALVDLVRDEGLQVEWLLETHAHADHITAMPFLKTFFDAPRAIGEHIVGVQQRCKTLFNLGEDFVADGSQFDHLFTDGEAFAIGNLPAQVIHTPGHTSDHVSYIIGDAVFVGDTLFMPDAGSARCDFPAGSARQLYQSVQRLFAALPDEQRLFVLHDYGTAERAPECATTMGDERRNNIHFGNATSEDAFVALREARDATLPMPVLILPAVQVNVRAGQLPPAESNGLQYLKIPLNEFTPHWSPEHD
ncbi:MAG: MBL fold metallo-hydrolase [Spiribacter sp.]|nr:MBL fold metallo-hydrolase [Spiribacter sp.]